jgi:feruloyl esterase
MLTWHGLADAIVPPGKTVDYYEAVAEAAGGHESAKAFNRLFLIPGVDHCGILKGPGIAQDGLDLLTAMEAWLEGEAPETISTTRLDADGNAEWTRPVCAFPARATHDGEGDPNAPESWRCE